MGDFETLFKNHYKWLCLKAFEVCADWQVSEDLVQDFFTAYWQKMNHGEGIAVFPPYAAVAIRNRAISYLRTQKLHAEKHLEIAAESTLTEEPVDLSPDDERQRKLLQALEQLPEQRRRIFLLHQVQRLKYAQIAENTGLSLNTVKTHLKLAYRQLREAALILISLLSFK